ncbi:MAG: glutamine--fructose-6-phosphate transaminase (isomerizing) [Patescibacteria group bacterium]|nr:glutamine--fructose-6-phosphate transaminase (isomerizing) [Patescibacteria group bacterium]
MCGIVCYTGTEDARSILLQGLKTLEYRGYDSAGIGLVRPKEPLIQLVREVGEVQKLVDKIALDGTKPATCGIGHTRWASHGKPSQENAHPHQDCEGKVIVVHNGDLEGHLTLKRELTARGHAFHSETDTEVIAHLLEEERRKGLEPIEAIHAALSIIRGTYALGVIFADYPEYIYLAKLSGSLIIGKASHGTLAVSDAPAILPYTQDVIRLRDYDVAVLRPEGYEIVAPNAEVLSRRTERLEGSVEDLQMDGHPHFMRKELFTQPSCFAELMRGRLDPDAGTTVLGGIRTVGQKLKEADQLILTGCGSAYYAGLIGRRFFERFAGIPTQVILANQLPFDETPITPKTVVISITQSGVTADTVEAQREAKRRGATTLGVVNAVGTTIPSENEGGVYLRVGTESGVASTKAFTAQAVALAMVALSMGRMRGMSLVAGQEVVETLKRLSRDAERMIGVSNEMSEIAARYSNAASMYYLGAGAFLPTVLEGALKLKEIAYIHAEAYASGEMKHGPLALIDKGFPVVVLAPQDATWNQTLSALAKLNAVGARVLLLTDSDNRDIGVMATDQVIMPPMPKLTAPILWTILLQRFAYEAAVAKKLNPDRPRHLAKTITVR